MLLACRSVEPAGLRVRATTGRAGQEADVTGLGSLFRRRGPLPPVTAPPLVVPRQTLDGWSLDGTPLARSVPKQDLRELANLLHGVASRAETPWTYERAAELLVHAGEDGQAYAVAEAWLGGRGARQPEHAQATRSLERTLERLRARLAAG